MMYSSLIMLLGLTSNDNKCQIFDLMQGIVMTPLFSSGLPADAAQSERR
jgi:hypothetical protein